MAPYENSLNENAEPQTAGPGPFATVVPFILRDVTLAGVNSVVTPGKKREEAWSRLAKDLDLEKLRNMTARARLEDVPVLAT